MFGITAPVPLEEQRKRVTHRAVNPSVRETNSRGRSQGRPLGSHHLDLLRRANDADLLRAYAPIVDRSTLALARILLRESAKSDLPTELLGPLFTSLAFLEELEDEPEIARACFFAIMTSRAVFWDDRVLSLMKADLESVC